MIDIVPGPVRYQDTVPEWAELPAGTVSVEITRPADLFIRDLWAIVARVDCRPWGEWAGFVYAPTQALEDPEIAGAILVSLDRFVRPWTRPDRDAMPTIVLFPSVDRLEAAWRRLRLDLRWRWVRLRKALR